MKGSEQLLEVLKLNLEINREISQLIMKTSLPPKVCDKLLKLIKTSEEQIENFKIKLDAE